MFAQKDASVSVYIRWLYRVFLFLILNEARALTHQRNRMMMKEQMFIIRLKFVGCCFSKDLFVVVVN